MFSFIKKLFTKQKQSITGNNNIAMMAERDIINIQYNVPQKIVDRLEELLQEKDIKLQEREGVITSWIQKYKELENQLASRTDDIAKQAKSFLDDGNLEDAEKLFKQALTIDLKNAANNAFSLAQIKSLQLNYQEAEAYYRQAVQLDPKNALYLNDLGLHLHTLGQYAEAEPLYQRSLAIGEKALGKDHPTTKIIRNNLQSLHANLHN